MAGRWTLHSPWGLTLAVLVVTGLSTASEVHGQVAAPPIGTPVVDFASVEGPMAPAAAMPWPVQSAQPANIPASGPSPFGVPVEMGLLDTITESLFGDAYAEGKWRPLSLRTFFSEGWLEPWAGGPAGQSGLTPRHGWLGSFEGVFYRLWLITPTYQNHLSKPFGGNAYSGTFTTFLPLSRRF